MAPRALDRRAGSRLDTPRTSAAPASAVGARGVIHTAVTGRAYVRDGDTIEVGAVPACLQGLHCPELGEPGGRAAASAMQRLTQGNEVRCNLTGERTYDRIVGSCHVGNNDLAAVLIRDGVCAHCPRYDTAGRYAEAQHEAGAWTRSIPGYCR